MNFGAVIVENRKSVDLRFVLDQHKPFLPEGTEIMLIDHFNVKGALDYNVLLTSYDFWDWIPFDKMLIFQHDSGLLRHGIGEFLSYDYVGAPWKFQEHGGNGGLSIRSKQAMLDTISHTPYSPILMGNEDVYFSNHLQGNLAPREVCKQFSVESIFELGTFGYHAIDKYLSPAQVHQVMSQYNVLGL